MNIVKIACVALVSVLFAACGAMPQSQQSEQPAVIADKTKVEPQRPAVAPMQLVVHCVTVKPTLPMQDPGFKAWVQKTMTAGKWCEDEQVEMKIVTSLGRTATKTLHLIGGEAIESIPGDIVGEFPLNITVKSSGGAAVSMRIGEPIPGRAILIVSEKKAAQGKAPKKVTSKKK